MMSFGATGWSEMGLELGSDPDSSSPKNVSDQQVCDWPRLSVRSYVCEHVSLSVSAYADVYGQWSAAAC